MRSMLRSQPAEEQREFALQQWRRTASQMLKECRPGRETASGKGGARTPKPRDYEAVFVLSPARSAKAASSAAIRRTLPGRAQWLRTQPRTAFPGSRILSAAYDFASAFRCPRP